MIEIFGMKFGKHGSLYVPADDAFSAAVDRGRVYAVVSQVGITSQAGLSLTTPGLTLPNPAGSKIKAKLWYAGAIYTVAPATAGAVWLAHGKGPNLADVTGTATTAHRNLKLGGPKPGIVPLLAATLPEIPVAIDLLGAMLTGAITTVPGMAPMERWYNGAVLVMPGHNVSIQTGVASGASGLFSAYIWEEEDE